MRANGKQVCVWAEGGGTGSKSSKTDKEITAGGAE